jgi:DnaD/phage-associated family protein
VAYSAGCEVPPFFAETFLYGIISAIEIRRKFMSDQITLHTVSEKQVTCVSNTFIDHYLPEADGEYVKIYLFLLRCLSGRDSVFSISRFADLLGHTERDIMKALDYWESRHLLRLEYDKNKKLVGICMLDPDDNQLAPLTVNLQKMPEKEPSAGEIKSREEASSGPVSLSEENREEIPTEPDFSPEERKIINQDVASKELIYVTEQYIDKPMSQNEADTVLFWHWTLGLSIELIEFLVEECIAAGHKSIRYMNKIAISWRKEGITTEEEARLASDIHSNAYYAIMKAFGIQGRKLTPREEDYLARWTKEFAFTEDLISEACQRTVMQTGKASFEYADTILSNWNRAHIHTLDEVRNQDNSHARNRAAVKGNASNMNLNKKEGLSSPSYDDESLQALEKKLLS